LFEEGANTSSFLEKFSSDLKSLPLKDNFVEQYFIILLLLLEWFVASTLFSQRFSVSKTCLLFNHQGQNVLLNMDNAISPKEDKSSHMFFRAMSVNLILQLQQLINIHSEL